jgi:outer membrane murein-binding lipoprotein Lpp
MARRLPIAATVVASALVAGCYVPRSRYDQANAQLRQEQAARRATEGDLDRARAEIAALTSSLGAREAALSTRDGQAAQAKLDADRLSTERDDAVGLVDQLRGELARAGDDLRTFSGQKQELESALAAAEAKAKELDQEEHRVEQKELLMRDLSLALGQDVTKGVVAVTAVEGKPAIRVAASAAFSGGELRPDAAAVVERLAAVLISHAAARVELSDLSTDATSDEERVARLQKVTDVLSNKGVGFERMGFALAPTAPAEPTAAAAPAPATPSKAPKPGASPWREGPGSIELVLDEP